MMKPYRIGVRLTSLVIFCLLSVDAYSQGVAVPSLSPPDANVSTASVITITAAVDPGTAAAPLIPSSVYVFKTDVNGNPLANMGLMRDDGTNGDAVAKDGIYTAQFAVNAAAAVNEYYRVSAAYAGVRTRSVSALVTLNVLPEIPDATVQQLSASIDSIGNHFAANVATLGLASAQGAALAEALSDPAIGPGNAFRSSDGSDLTIYVTYIDPGSGAAFKIAGVISLRDPATPTKGAGAVSPGGIPATAQNPSSDQILLFAPVYTSDFGLDADASYSRASAGHFMTFSPKPLAITKDAAGSVDSVKTWGDYSVIIVDTHGVLVQPSTPGGVVQVGLLTSTSDKAPTKQIKNDLAKGRLVDTTAHKLAFTPAFVSTYIVDKQRNPFIYLGACDSMFNSTMWDALRKKGAKAAMGWTHSIYPSDDAAALTALLNAMLPTAGTANPSTLQQAYSALGGLQTGKLVTGEPGAPKLVLSVDPATPQWNNLEFIPGTAVISVTGLSAIGYSPDPASVAVNGFYSVNISTFEINGTTGCSLSDAGVQSGERGFPTLFSTTVAPSADFFGTPNVVGLPTNGAVGINRRPCSSFFANLRDVNGNGLVWINATGRGEQYSPPFIKDWEYQLRYYSGSPASNYTDRTCTIGIVANADYYSPIPVTCNLTCNNNLFGKLSKNLPACN